MDELPLIPLKKPSPSREFVDIDEECEYLNLKLRGFSERTYSPLVLRPLQFVADLEHPETKALRIKYDDLRRKISAIYAQGDFLEITLKQLTEG